MLWLRPVGAVDDRIRHVHADRLLAPARAQNVQRHASDHRRQPGAEILDGVGIRAAEPQPGFLHGVVGFAQRAEHPIGHRPQPSTLLLEALRQPFALIHRSHSSVASGQTTRPARPGWCDKAIERST
jgi:hypothetical protein